jgi:hypothetical protein
MRFEARHRLTGTVEEVERALFDDRYLDFVIAHHGVLLEARVLEKNDDGARLRRRVRYLPRPVIARIGPNEVPPAWFAFIEDSTWDRARRELTFKNTPTSPAIEGMLHNVGTLRFRDVGGECERTMEGEISLRLPFFLTPVAMLGEALIQREGLKILDAEARVMNRFLTEVLRAAR